MQCLSLCTWIYDGKRGKAEEEKSGLDGGLAAPRESWVVEGVTGTTLYTVDV